MLNQTVADVMTKNPQSLAASTSVRRAAQQMRRSAVGAVVVEREGWLCGILTDRDVVVRCVAEGGDCDVTPIGAICSAELSTVSPVDTVRNAISLMWKRAVRRIVVVENGRAVGIVSLGDLAQARAPSSVLAGISAAAPNN